MCSLGILSNRGPDLTVLVEKHDDIDLQHGSEPFRNVVVQSMLDHVGALKLGGLHEANGNPG